MARHNHSYYGRVPAHEQLWDDAPAWPKWIALAMVGLGFIPLLNLLNFALFLPMLITIGFTYSRSTHSPKNSLLALLFVFLAEIITVASIIWSLFHL